MPEFGEFDRVHEAPPLVVSSRTGPGELPDDSPTAKHVDASGQEIPDTEPIPAISVGVGHVPFDMWTNAPPSLVLPEAKHVVVKGHEIPVVEKPSCCMAHELTLRTLVVAGV
jgi:hypothetical protein